MDNRPPPPPHGNNASQSGNRASGLPNGNYDIFVVPPHSAGSGFLYLPSLQPHRNSFLAGVICTLAVVGIWAIVIPIIKQWFSTVAASGGAGVLLLILGVGVLGWAFGKTQIESETAGRGPHPGTGNAGSTGNTGARSGFTPGPDPFAGANGSTPFGAPPPRPGHSWQQTDAGSGSAKWQQAREEMKKKEDERRKKEETEKAKKEAAEKLAQARAREAREKEAREKSAQERLKKEKDAQAAKAAAEAKTRNYQKPTAQSYAGEEEEYSYRPYDIPKRPRPTGSPSSFYSESASWAGSQSTARTTPPPSNRGPYTSKDENKIQIKAVYAFTDHSPRPAYQLIAGFGNVTDGLVLRMGTEGLFVDDDVRGVGQREWDVKAYTLKLVETGDHKSLHLLRATTRDADGKKYVFVIPSTEAWKVALGLQRLRKGAQVRSLGVNGLSTGETMRVLATLGW